MSKRPVNLYVVSRLLLSGVSYKEIHELFGWPKSTIRDAAANVGYRLPSPGEIKIAADPLVSCLVETVARQGFSKREAQRLLRLPRPQILRWWPSGVVEPEMAGAAAKIAAAMLEAGEAPEQVRAETGLTPLQIHRLRPQ